MTRKTISTFAAVLALAAVPAGAQAASRTATVSTPQATATSTAQITRTGPGTRVTPPSGTTVMRVEAAGAGIPGYDDARCQELLSDWGKLVDFAAQEIMAGENADSTLDQAKGTFTLMDDNCSVSGIS